MDLSGSKWRENKIGPRTEPWGAPHERGAEEEMELPRLTQNKDRIIRLNLILI